MFRFPSLLIEFQDNWPEMALELDETVPMIGITRHGGGERAPEAHDLAPLCHQHTTANNFETSPKLGPIVYHIEETKSDYIINIEISRVYRHDVVIELGEEGILRVSGRLLSADESNRLGDDEGAAATKNKNFHRESRHGVVQRDIKLPVDSDYDLITAAFRYRGGVEVTVPKLSERKICCLKRKIRVVALHH